MASLNLIIANDIANAILKNYTRGKTFKQTLQIRPLLRFLNNGKLSFPGGNQFVSDPIQGAFMSDPGQPGSGILGGGGQFFMGYQEDAQLFFSQGQNILRAEYKWFEVHAGLVITWTELKKDGITITEGNRRSEHADMALTRLTGLMENRMEDFGESWARSMNLMLWKDGTQDPLQVPGVRSLLIDNPTAGVSGGLDRAVYSYWRNLAVLGIVASATNQTLTIALRSNQRPLRRYGGIPNKFLCGSHFLDQLELEVQAKGILTQEGFTDEGRTDIGMADISMRGIGRFEYDPTLDDLNMSGYCFEFDSRRIKLRPMEGEDNKLINPERPYQYMVFLKSMTWTGTLVVRQMNCHGVFSTT